MIHLLTTGVLIVLLERFFRLDEHYTWRTFERFLVDFWHLGIEGMLWSIAYQFVFLFIHTSAKLSQEQHRVKVLKEELQSAHLKGLRHQLNPHFLFNAMNSIAMKVRLGEPKAAVVMIAALNDLLRLALATGADKHVPLSAELKLLDKYLLIEKTRFGDLVEVKQDIPSPLLCAMVPELILQPLVENAFKHGVKDGLTNQTIAITASQEDDHLVLAVYNSLPEELQLHQIPSGVGLTNIIQRLRRLYGTSFRFQCTTYQSGVSFIITIPLHQT